eukprot:gene1775-3436_t
MDNVIRDLQSSDIKVKQSALDDLFKRLESHDGSIAALSRDVKLRVMTACLNCLKDSNTKISLVTLDCIQIFLIHNSDSFQPLVHIAFDLLVARLADGKDKVRLKSSEVTLILINVLGLVAGYEKLMTFITHRNFRIREQILEILIKLKELYGDDITALHNITKKVSSLLTDSQPSVRQLAVVTLANFLPIFGDSLLEDLESDGSIRAVQIQMIRDVGDEINPIATNKPFENLSHNASSSSSSALSSQLPISKISPPSKTTRNTTSALNAMDTSTASRLKSTTSRSNTMTSLDPKRSSLSSHNSKSRDSNSGSIDITSTTSINSNSSNTADHHHHSSSRSSVNSWIDERLRLDSMLQQDEHDVDDDVTTTVLQDSSKYRYYLRLLSEGPPPKPTVFISSTWSQLEKELQRLILNIAHVFTHKTDEWQERMNALVSLQGIGLALVGENSKLEFLVNLIRENIHELMSVQITDLRSSVCKEACRTVAMLAKCTGVHFIPLAELWIPSILKVVPVKTQVMQSAADRSIRIILSAHISGFPRVLSGCMLECTASKNGALRAMAMEYFCLACAIWKVETLEKLMPMLKQLVRTTVGNADPNARRGARQLFWILRNRPGLNAKKSMDDLLSDLEIGLQKNITAEMNSSSSSSYQELQQLLGGSNSLLQTSGGGCSGGGNTREILLILSRGLDQHFPYETTHTNTPVVLNTAEEDGPRETTTTTTRRSLSKGNSGSSNNGNKTPGKRHLSVDSFRDTRTNSPITSTVAITSTNDRFHSHSKSNSVMRESSNKSNTSATNPIAATAITTITATSVAGNKSHTTSEMSSRRSMAAPQRISSHTTATTSSTVNANTAGSTSLSASSTTISGMSGSSRRMSVAVAGPMSMSTQRRSSSVDRPPPPTSTSPSKTRHTNTTTATAPPLPPSNNSSNSNSKYGVSGRIRQSSSSSNSNTVALSSSSSSGGLGLGLLVDGPKRIVSKTATTSTATATAVSKALPVHKISSSSTNINNMNNTIGIRSEDISRSLSSSSDELKSISSLVQYPMTSTMIISSQTTTEPASSLSSSVFVSPMSSPLTIPMAMGVESLSSSSPDRGVEFITRDIQTNNTNNNYNNNNRNINNCVHDDQLEVEVEGDVSTSTFSLSLNEVKDISMESIRVMAEDSLWSERLNALDIIILRLQQLFTNKDYLSISNTTTNNTFIDGSLDILLQHIDEIHLKVASRALDVISILVEKSPEAVINRLGVLLTGVFVVLGDRRPKLREQANALLNVARASYEPVVLATVLFPKLLDVTVRSRAALIQFLTVIAPHCEQYLSQMNHMKAILNRLATILGGGDVGGGGRSSPSQSPSSSLLASGKRLLELLYKVTPQVVLSQVYTLPVSQQVILKKLLSEGCRGQLLDGGDVDVMVAAAGHMMLEEENSTSSRSPGSSSLFSTTSTTSYDKSHYENNNQNSNNNSQMDSFRPYRNTSTDFDLYMSPPKITSSRNNKNYPNAMPTSSSLSPADVAAVVPLSSLSRSISTTTATTTATTTSSSASLPLPYSTKSTPPTTPKRNMKTYSPKTNYNHNHSNNNSAASSPCGSGRNTNNGNRGTPVKATRDLPWLLAALRPDATLALRSEAGKVLKRLVKQGDDSFWTQNCAQIVSALLEAFIPNTATSHYSSQCGSNGNGTVSEGAFNTASSSSSLLADSQYLTLHQTPLTGLTPPPVSCKSLRETSNCSSSNNPYMPLYGSGVVAVAGGGRDRAMASMSLSAEDSSEMATSSNPNRRAEAMHVSCKALLLIVRVQGRHLQSLLELLTSRLCSAAAFAPVAVMIHCEQILAGVAALDAVRTVRSVLPFINATGIGNVQVKLLALHALSTSMKSLTAPNLLELLPYVTAAILPMFSSTLVDIRKAVVFVLVEAFLVVGDALLPFVADLAPAQRKLLTIYIDRQMSQRNPPSSSTNVMN